ncbi:scyllo-inositol 2-dehydrogenase (NADP+) [Arthrobacter sp. V4I6]|uniref:Gfo/Idh/MocA family protein n=1 Tax=unclassified Arthrobacter TaxID=235627 RepID=UPI0027817258|nr:MULTISPECIES: Gfo/Idh/MocA family oxidoreductase [unclassified Arthrobacter]MDQ0820347.1 scyllo-inositol 2-dehydrogenase (NADP+) [Arthrobacter sp. V1I7]MDQ0854528.1 scyllo-inositol 2-dehydrogenase (NADP+) [Arthrobacter sp. V4I6]
MRQLTASPIRTAVVGFGVSGKVFHAPLIAADPGYSLDFIVTADPARAAEAARLYPQARVVPTPEALFALSGGLDLVILGTPPLTHFDVASTAMAQGLHVVVDKPFVTTSAQGEGLISQATEAGVQLTVFQNRRWDADFLTLKKVLREGALGEVRSFESRFEWWRPEGFGNWRDTASLAEGGGILHDLGAHLIDQAVQLFGAVEESYGETANHGPQDGADTEAFVSLLHESGIRSRLWMNGMAAQVGPRFHVLGSQSGYTKWGLDHQEPALAAGMSPLDPSYGVEPQDAWGVLGIDGSTTSVPAETGAYPQFYAQLATALRGEGPLPVNAAESLEVLRTIEKIHAFA